MATLIKLAVRNRLIRLLPGILASRADPPKHFVIAAGVHFYGAELGSAVAGWGVSNPLLLVLSGKDAQLGGTRGGLLVFAIVWTIFVLWFKRSRVADRLRLGEACKKSFGALEDEVHKILRQDESPLNALVQMAPRLEEAMTQHKEGFFADPKTEVITEAGKREADRLVELWGDSWRDQMRPPKLAAE